MDLWKEHNSNLGYFIVCNWLPFVRLTDSKKPKLDVRATTRVFLRYILKNANNGPLNIKSKNILWIMWYFCRNKNLFLDKKNNGESRN